MPGTAGDDEGAWDDGTILTKSRINQMFVQFSVAASRAAAGVLGRMHFASDTRQWSRDNGVSWTNINTLPQTVVKASDQTKASDIVIAPDDDLVVALGANDNAFFWATIRASAANTTPDIDMTFTVPSGATGGFFLGPGVAAGLFNTPTAFATEVITALSATEQMGFLWGVVKNGATPGNLSFAWAQNVSDTGVTTVHAESALMVAIQ